MMDNIFKMCEYKLLQEVNKSAINAIGNGAKEKSPKQLAHAQLHIGRICGLCNLPRMISPCIYFKTTLFFSC